MSDILKDFLSSGRKLLDDTKSPSAKTTKKQPPGVGTGPVETDPHKIFQRRTIQEKPKKSEVVEDIKKFIKQAEDDL
jgi:methionine synthase II (cobalamin-independent)